MSVSIAVPSERGPAYQPYQCHICQSRFTRHENLKRHAALHSRSGNEAALRCEFCQATFSRPDLKHRHMTRKHKDRVPVKRRFRSGDRATSTSPSVESNDPESYSGSGRMSLTPEDDDASFTASAAASLMQQERQSRPSITESTASFGQPLPDANWLDPGALLGAAFLKSALQFDNSLASFNLDQDISESLLPTTNDLPHFSQLQDDWYPSATQTAHGCHLFFTHVSNFVPFLHQPTFNSTRTARHLVLAMLCLGYQYGEDPDCGHQAGSGEILATRCFHRARALIVTEGDLIPADDLTHNVSLVQTYLLLQIAAMMYLCTNSSGSANAPEMHSRMISLARARGLIQPVPVEAVTTQDLESLWLQFIRAESHKRTLFAVHQIDALWYQLLSLPRSVSHLEIKHDLPCPEDFWTAPSSAEWAHRQLVSRSGSPSSSVKYVDAVRRFLSPEVDLTSLPAFDPYGAINIVQFLISSAREISGWSTMTGMLSMERFEAVRSALVALSPLLHPSPETTCAALLCEATWETAMIELQLWSPAHMGGIVEGSMDAVLDQSTRLAPSCEFLCEFDTAKAVQPHVDWFLRYLDDDTLSSEAEAPWIALYAYKAFLIALQLVRGGVEGAMQAVEVEDGDVEGALAWARRAFRRRQRCQLGKIVLRCLDALEK